MARRGEKMSSEYWRELNKRRTAYRRAYYRANRQKILDDKKNWIASNKSYHEEYLKNYRESHRKVQRERTKHWRDRNPHQIAAQAVLRRKRLREKCVNDPGILLFYKLARSANPKRCYYCQKTFGGVADVDHVIPITRGGWHCSSNLSLSCPSCNRHKSTKLPSEFVLSGQMLFNL